VQCGFCTPGILISSHALLKRNPNPSEDEIREALVRKLVPLHWICTYHRECQGSRQNAIGYYLTCALRMIFLSTYFHFGFYASIRR